MLDTSPSLPRIFWITAVVALLGASLAPGATTPPDPAGELDRAMAAAEGSLRIGELQIADSDYHAALQEGWLLMGAIEAAEGHLQEARDAFRTAADSAVETQRALQSLALVELRMGEAAEAVRVLTPVVGRHPSDLQSRQMLAQALAAAGKPEEAVQELEEARTRAPDNLELAFALGSGYLKMGKLEPAEKLFAAVLAGRPIPQTHILIGRTYADFGDYDRARAELEKALRQDPRVKRAHYYLGRIIVMDEGPVHLDQAIAEFRKELAVDPKDPVTSLHLGMALVEDRRAAEALPVLEVANAAPSPRAEGFYYQGRALQMLHRPGDALAAFEKALELAPGQAASDFQIGSIHYQMARSLRQLGRATEAEKHFAEAKRRSGARADNSRERMTRYLTGRPDPQASRTVAPMIEASPLTGLDPAARKALRKRATSALARAYLNLGILQAQKKAFDRAAELIGQAAAVDPGFPRVQYSLGVARFNAGQYAEATGPLEKALAADPGDAGAKRMLAMAWLNTEAYDKAAALLQDDPERAGNPSLQYAYGVALVKSGHAAEAQGIFARLLAQHRDSAELDVVLGQAYAQQGDYPSAIESLKRALELKPDVADAGATLGVIYLKQGKLPEAEKALRGEIAAHPGNLEAAHDLATVLDLENRSEEALPLLRGVLAKKPDFANARYLLGKILLGRGEAGPAAEQLETAARLAPEDANIHYQLGQAYQKLGRTEDAQKQFEIFRGLKEKRRNPTP